MARIDHSVVVPDELGPLAPVVAGAGRLELEERLDAGGARPRSRGGGRRAGPPGAAPSGGRDPRDRRVSRRARRHPHGPGLPQPRRRASPRGSPAAPCGPMRPAPTRRWPTCLARTARAPPAPRQASRAPTRRTSTSASPSTALAVAARGRAGAHRRRSALVQFPRRDQRDVAERPQRAPPDARRGRGGHRGGGGHRGRVAVHAVADPVASGAGQPDRHAARRPADRHRRVPLGHQRRDRAARRHAAGPDPRDASGGRRDAARGRHARRWWCPRAPR